jgi:hypothetical protein
MPKDAAEHDDDGEGGEEVTTMRSVGVVTSGAGEATTSSSSGPADSMSGRAAKASPAIWRLLAST